MVSSCLNYFDKWVGDAVMPRIDDLVFPLSVEWFVIF